MTQSVLIALFLLPFLAGLIGYILLPSIIQIAEGRNLFEKNNVRKIHTKKTCALGGIAIFVSAWLSDLVVSGLYFDFELKWIFIAGLLLFLTSLKDDLIKLTAINRLIIQIITAGMLYIAGIRFNVFDSIVANEMLASILNFGGTTFFIIIVINAYNFIDGIDGLVGGLGAINMFAFAVLFWHIDAIAYCSIAISMVGALLVFLRYNFGGAKIFMGDSGSTFIGLLVAILSIQFFNLNNNISQLSISTFILISSIISIPVIDLVKVALVRIMKGGSPLKADRTHIHHQLLKLGMNASKVCFILYGLNIILITLNVFFEISSLLAFGSLLFCPLCLYLGIHMLQLYKESQMEVQLGKKCFEILEATLLYLLDTKS